jgi:hypothetical protein
MDRATHFREAAAAANHHLRRTRWRYSKKLKRLAIDHYLERRREGCSHRNIAKELGISLVTLRTWTADSKPQAAFRPVHIAGSSPTAALAALRVVTPSGLQIEGLSFEQVVELSRAWQ